MFVNSVTIENVNGVKFLKLDLGRFMNLICGPNGVGKSTALDSIGATFSHGGHAEIKKLFSAPTGKVLVDASGTDGGQYSIELKSATPGKETVTGAHALSKYVFALKASRMFKHEPLNAVGRDPVNPLDRAYAAAQTGISIADTKNWFVNRYLYSNHPDSLNPAQVENFKLAKSCFSLLNQDYKFATVEASTNEILVDTPTGRISFEYLSSGFKSCLSIMFGLIKEVEYRFPNTKAKELEAIVLIDEIELHLHPEWQSEIINVLLATFTKMQFICSTHSPHVIQNAERDSVIALETINGDVRRRDLSKFASSFKGWTIEEVLEDVMGMPDTRTATFNDLAAKFGEAIDKEDAETARKLFGELDTLLHPKNSFRKVARLQLGAVGVKLD